MTTKLPNDQSRFADGLGATQASRDDFDSASSPKNPARAVIRQTLVLFKDAADGMAATTTAYTATDMRCPRQSGRILGARVMPQAALASSDAAYATIEVVSADGLGGAGVVMASATTKTTGGGGTGDWVAGNPVPLTVTATPANQRFAAHTVIGQIIAKTGAGVIVPVCSIEVDVEWEAADDGYKV